jgi:hypothetical protein
MTQTDNIKPEPWRNSRAKAEVKKLLESGKFYMTMSEEELFKLSELLQQ